ncbi:MAG: GNAT family N-acetyltransferase [Candidatus Aenigmarchaeota archaeon]|nr:GNAT family N-acetyltransferase [Candidatus Aenigmarchaeota archaeon]
MADAGYARISEPKTGEEFERYYDLRWKILRAPWNQPRRSERDNLEDESIHVMCSGNSGVLGVGRVHFNSADEAQIRYMAIDESQQGRGIGGRILLELERRAVERGAKYVILNSRESAVGFYRRHGYEVAGDAPAMFGIMHYRMIKNL